ncbi:MAG: DNA-binding domain-containing protein [Gammaproteobacteria bacterium]|jgi:hypothetical protein
MTGLHDQLAGFARAIDAGEPLGHIGPRTGLDVYAAAWRENRVTALALTYATVRALTGEAFFQAMATRFAESHPSRSGNLDDYGRGFADFISTYEPVAGLPYLGDCARLDWLCQESLLAPDAVCAPLDALTSLPEAAYPGLRFALHPALRLLRSDYPVFRIWRLCQQPDGEGEAVSLDAGGESVAVARDGGRVAVWCLQPAEYAFVGSLEQGCRIEAAWETARAKDADFAPDRILSWLAASGLIVAWQTGDL